jgi:hypothetical protein
MIFRVVALNRYKQRITSVSPTSQCRVSGRRMSPNMKTSSSFFNNYTSPETFNFNLEKGGYDLDNMVLFFDPLIVEPDYLELKSNRMTIRK